MWRQTGKKETCRWNTNIDYCNCSFNEPFETFYFVPKEGKEKRKRGRAREMKNKVLVWQSFFAIFSVKIGSSYWVPLSASKWKLEHFPEHRHQSLDCAIAKSCFSVFRKGRNLKHDSGNTWKLKETGANHEGKPNEFERNLFNSGEND